jgi:hypothetical protein
MAEGPSRQREAWRAEQTLGADYWGSWWTEKCLYVRNLVPNVGASPIGYVAIIVFSERWCVLEHTH